ncbi:MAG: RdgB/HAM1 family non-canonical purine NTP pyrophosphatase [Spirochaetales bacterium]
MSLTLLLNTANEHKKREMQDIARPHTLRTKDEFTLSGEFEETGSTFLENALGKAQTLADELTKEQFHAYAIDAVIADDSGVCVSALDGAPGIYSARFGQPREGRKLTSAEQNDLLLEKMRNATDRSAYYTCCMVAILADGRVVSVEDRLYGEIATRPSRGGGGFGYDPVFFLPDRGVCVADLSDEEKHRISHRGKATRALLSALGSMLR